MKPPCTKAEIHLVIMSLAETFELIRPSIVALGSRVSVIERHEVPIFPTILGTGFVVDERGIVVTNRHVATALQQLPPRPDNGQSPAFAMVFGGVERSGGSHSLGVALVDIKGYALPDTFSPGGEFYGEPMPDLAFLQLRVQGLTALRLATETNTLAHRYVGSDCRFRVRYKCASCLQKGEPSNSVAPAWNNQQCVPFPVPSASWFYYRYHDAGWGKRLTYFLTGFTHGCWLASRRIRWN